MVVGFEGEASKSFSARRMLLLPALIATKASLGVLEVAGILVTAGERKQYKIRPVKTRQGKARQGKAREGKT